MFLLPHPKRSKEEAKKAVESEAQERDNLSGRGHATHPGFPRARAGAPANVSGFGWPVDGKWKATSLKKTVTSGGGFTQTTQVKAGDDNKTKKDGGSSSSSSGKPWVEPTSDGQSSKVG